MSRCGRSSASSRRSTCARAAGAAAAGRLGLPIPDNDLTARVRREAAQDLARGPPRRVPARARGREPLVLVLEDCHWLDPLSRDLLEALGARGGRAAVLFVLAYRPAADAGGGLGLERLPQFDELVLAELDADDAAALIRSKLAQMLGADAEASAASSSSSPRAAGEPVLRRGAAELHPQPGRRSARTRRRSRLELPESLHSLILSADRHARRGAAAHAQGGERPRPGRSARRCCRASTPSSAALDEVEEHLARCARPTSSRLDLEAEQAYLFKHVVTQEVAYESMPFAIRVDAARARRRPTSRRPRPTRSSATSTCSRTTTGAARTWRRSASTSAAPATPREAAYANAAAIDYFEAPRAAASRARAGRRAAEARQGARARRRLARAEQVDARGAGARRGARRRCIARLVRRRRSPRWRASRAASTRRCAARGARRALRDGRRGERRRQGAASRRHASPRSAATTARRSRTTRRASRSASGSATRRAWRRSLEPRRSSPSTAATTATARDGHERALALRTEIGDRWAIGDSMNEPRHDRRATRRVRGRARLVRGVDAAQPRGRRRLDGRDQPQQPRQRDARARRLRRGAASTTPTACAAYRDYDDRWALAFLLEDIGILAALSGERRPRSSCRRAPKLREEIGAPRAPALEEELAAALADARAALGDAAAEEAPARGRALAPEKDVFDLCQAARRLTFAARGRRDSKNASLIGLSQTPVSRLPASLRSPSELVRLPFRSGNSTPRIGSNLIRHLSEPCSAPATARSTMARAKVLFSRLVFAIAGAATLPPTPARAASTEWTDTTCSISPDRRRDSREFLAARPSAAGAAPSTSTAGRRPRRPVRDFQPLHDRRATMTDLAAVSTRPAFIVVRRHRAPRRGLPPWWRARSPRRTLSTPAPKSAARALERFRLRRHGELHRPNRRHVRVRPATIQRRLQRLLPGELTIGTSSPRHPPLPRPLYGTSAARRPLRIHPRRRSPSTSLRRHGVPASGKDFRGLPRPG